MNFTKFFFQNHLFKNYRFLILKKRKKLKTNIFNQKKNNFINALKKIFKLENKI